jgi:hypothetical protein
MKRCARCPRPPRQDDPCYTLQWVGPDGGTITAGCCRDCTRDALGLPPEPAPTYPWPDRGALSLLVCAICEHAMREGDKGTCIRIAAEDIQAAGVHDPEKVKPACYQACEECVELYRPHMHKRLSSDSLLWPSLPPLRQFNGNWLL